MGGYYSGYISRGWGAGAGCPRVLGPLEAVADVAFPSARGGSPKAPFSGKYFINGRERLNMSTTLGKSAGIALLLAASLMVVLYAMGVFSARPASAEGHGLTLLRVKQVVPGATDPQLILTPTFDADSAVSDYTATFPFDEDTTAQALEVTARAMGAVSSTVTISVASGGMIEGEDEEPEAHQARVNIAPDSDINDLTGTLITVTSRAHNSGAERVYRIRVKQDGEITNSKEAGKAVRLTLNANIRARVGSDITIGLPSFGLPESIDKANVTIDDGENSAQPRDVTVSGSNVTLTMGKLLNSANNNDDENVIGVGATGTEAVIITIASRANIENPNTAGTYLVTVDSNDSPNASGVDARRVATVDRTITVTPKSAGKNAEVTVTGKGFASGSATIFRDRGTLNEYDADDDEVLGTAEVTNGAFTFTTSAITDNSTIQVVDFNGNLAIEGKPFNIKASIKVSPTQVSPAEELTVELVDWTEGEQVTHIRFGGTGVPVAVRGNADATGEKVTVNVPSTVRLGSLKVEALVDNTSKASASVTVRAHELNISPTAAVPGQEITIQGSGFGNGARIDSLTFGGSNDVYATTADPAKPTADTNGNITITVNVPDLVNPGSREVKVTANNNRIGTAALTVPKPALTVTPTESLRGTSLTLTGTGFTANDSVQIKYDRSQAGTVSPQVVTSVTVSSTGNFTANFDVPSFARIGQTSKITVSSQLNENNDTFDAVTVDHKTPKPAITLSPERAAAGSTISISGINFAGFAPVAELMIGDRDVKPVPTPATNNSGAITMDGILVPQLDAGSHTVKLKIGDQTVTKFLMVTDAPVSTAPADVFEPLVEAENLTVVWHYDNATGTWTSYSPTVPAELNDLDSVATGTIVWVQVTAATTFPGGNPSSLVAGWNLITLK